MNLKLIVASQLIALGLAGAIGYGWAHSNGAAALAKAEKGWSEEREKLARASTEALNAQRVAEQRQAEAIHQAAESYEKGKADAEKASHDVVADLRSGALRLRDQWATCRATAEVLVASGGRQPNAAADDREASAGRIVRAAAQCDAQVVGLQAALIGERVGQ